MSLDLDPSSDVFIAEMEYDGSGNLIYYGKAAPGTAVGASAWQIRRLDYDGSGNLTDILFAGGTKDFVKAWTGRAGYAYF